jgi:hypothetical protein
MVKVRLNKAHSLPGVNARLGKAHVTLLQPPGAGVTEEGATAAGGVGATAGAGLAGISTGAIVSVGFFSSEDFKPKPLRVALRRKWNSTSSRNCSTNPAGPDNRINSTYSPARFKK